MSRDRAILCCLSLSLVVTVRAAAAIGTDRFAAEVYRDDNLAVHAGISARDGQIVHFGDVLSFVLVVSWNDDEVSLKEPDERFFTDAWPEDAGPALLDHTTTRGSGGNPDSRKQRTVFRFQILDCPGEQPTCPGDRQYELPEFTLYYRNDEKGEPVAVNFRPEPRTLTVMTTISRDAEDQLHPFLEYFPTGAYPEPLTVTDRKRASLTTTGIGLLILLGGLMMWPFRFRKQNPFVAKSPPRWRQLLEQLQNDAGDNESRLADRLRRCLVWYCSDELEFDAFEWLEPGRTKRDEPTRTELRSLFMDLIQAPGGRSAELKSRLTALIGDKA